MKNIFILGALLCCAGVNAQTESASPQYCTREQQGTLESRVQQADVVMTGTVIRVETEHRAPWNFLDGRWVESVSEAANPRPGSQPVGFVKLWRVVKGSLAQVENQTSGPRDLLSFEDTSENSVLATPVLKLYGVRNDKLCGSYVKTGDTRIFFLKKYPDFRDIIDSNIGSGDSDLERLDFPGDLSKDVAKIEEMSAPVPPKAQVLPAIPLSLTSPDEPLQSMLEESGRTNLALTDVANGVIETNSTMSEPAFESQAYPKRKKPGKKKKKGGKNKKKKGQKKKRKGDATTKSGKKPKKRGRKKGGRKKRKSSESLSREWKRLADRPKRSVEVINMASRMNERGVKIRRNAADMEPRSVLVLYSPPARITLANLNGVENMANLP